MRPPTRPLRASDGRASGTHCGRPGSGSRSSPSGTAAWPGERSATEALIGSEITGIVAYNDLTAIGALRALRRAGIGVPEAISVIGFDDIELAAWTDPPLTTVRQPTDALGRWAVEHLVDLLAGQPVDDATGPVLLEPELVVRESTAAQGGV